MKEERSGTTLVEILVAGAVLLAAVVAFSGLLGGERRGLRLSLDRLVAQQVLDGLEGALATRSPNWFRLRGFPSDEEAWTPLHETVLDDHPLLLDLGAEAEDATPTRDLLAAEALRLGLRRVVLYHPGDPDDPDDPARVTLRVRYSTPAGGERLLQAVRVLR